MKKNEKNGWSNYVSKKVKCVFDDYNKVSISIGKVKGFDDDTLFLIADNKEEAIPKARIIRVEVLKNESDV